MCRSRKVTERRRRSISTHRTFPKKRLYELHCCRKFNVTVVMQSVTSAVATTCCLSFFHLCKAFSFFFYFYSIIVIWSVCVSIDLVKQCVCVFASWGDVISLHIGLLLKYEKSYICSLLKVKFIFPLADLGAEDEGTPMSLSPPRLLTCPPFPFLSPSSLFPRPLLSFSLTLPLSPARVLGAP